MWLPVRNFAWRKRPDASYTSQISSYAPGSSKVFLFRYLETGTIKRREGSGRPTKITVQVKLIVKRQMRLDDETTAIQLFALCQQNRIEIRHTHPVA